MSTTIEIVGVDVFSHPPSERVLARLPCDRMAGVELGRLVLLSGENGVPGNGESFFLGRCFRHLREAGIEALISHSDPVPRRALDGSYLTGQFFLIPCATNLAAVSRVMNVSGNWDSAHAMTSVSVTGAGGGGCGGQVAVETGKRLPSARPIGVPSPVQGSGPSAAWYMPLSPLEMSAKQAGCAHNLSPTNPILRPKAANNPAYRGATALVPPTTCAPP